MTAVPNDDTYVLFTVAETTYAVRSDDVRHMEMIEQITPVPKAGPFLEGVVFSRGQVVPVLNLRARFGFPRAPKDLRTRLVVLQLGERWVGLMVDSAREFIRIPRAAIQPPGTALTDLSTNYIAGVATMGERIVLVLNVADVLDPSVMSGDLTAAVN